MYKIEYFKDNMFTSSIARSSEGVDTETLVGPSETVEAEFINFDSLPHFVVFINGVSRIVKVVQTLRIKAITKVE